MSHFPRNPYEHEDPEGLKPPDIELCRHGHPVGDCDSCAEAAYEYMIEQFHGSDQPQTDEERHQMAAIQRRDLERRR